MSRLPRWSNVQSPNAGLLVAIFLNICCPVAAQTLATVQDDVEEPIPSPIVKGLDPSAIDKTADPCVDFYQYACGNWIKKNPLPADQVRWIRSYSQLKERNRYQLWQELDQAANNPNGLLQKQYGDYFASCMDVAEIEKKGLQPLEPSLQQISALNNTKGIAALVGDLASAGEPAPPFQLDVERDQKDSSTYILNILQGGLTLPNRSLYVGDHSEYVRKRLTSHMIHVFMLAGDTMERAMAEAQAAIGIETELAKASTPFADDGDPESRYHIYTTAEFQKLAPDFDFAAYFSRVTVRPIERLNVTNPEFIKAVNNLLRSMPIDAWRSYFRWHVLSEQAEALPKAYRDEDFAFWGGYFVRQEKPAPRWLECTVMTEMALGDAVSQNWVKRNFSPAAKAGAEQLVVSLKDALRDEIRSLPWMSEETKNKAEAKLAAVQTRIGYPDHWRDYSKLKIDRSDFLANVHRHTVFQRNELLRKLEKPVDEKIWDLAPSTVEARYVPSMNGLYISAGILQSPFFDLASDPGVNFGGIGVVAAHELTHAFDDLGSNFDDNGDVREWQTPVDRKNFAERTSCEVAEYNQFGAMPDPEDLPLIKVNGKFTQAENTADNGGLRIALLALTQALATQGKSVENKIDDLTEQQRFFLTFAQTWCQNQNFRSARRATSADPHSPGRWRVNGAVQNLDEFGKAFQCSKGAPMYPVNSCRVW
jgi:putative endopeptidase